MKTLRIKNSWLSTSDLRLDATFHLSDGPMTKLKLKNSPWPVSILSKETKLIFKGDIFKRVYVANSDRGHRLMTASDMMQVNIEGGKFISKKYTNTSNLFIEPDWILVSRSGTLGNTVYTNAAFESVIGTDDLIRILPNNKNVKSGFMYAYLSSKYGRGLLTQSSYGGVVKHIEPHHIDNLPIPILSKAKQEEIHSQIVEASELRSEASKVLKMAISGIESEFAMKRSEKVFTVNVRKVKSGDKYTNENRLESDFYQPSVEDIQNQIKKRPWALLGDLSESVTISNLRGRTFVKEGIILFTGQSLGLLKPDRSKQLSKTLTKNISSNTTRDGDVLISAFGTLGKVEYCYQNFYSGVFASQQIARVRVDESKIDAGYVYLFLKSKIGQALIQKYKTGSVIEWANWNNFCSILIPVPKDKGKSLGDIARIIANKFDAAYQKEANAISIIEQEIESWQK